MNISTRHAILFSSAPRSGSVQQAVTRQPAISSSIAFQHPFNRAGGRTSTFGKRMKISYKALALSFLAILTCSGVALATNIDVRVRIPQKGDDEKVITRDNLLKIKQFILQNGRRETYCNMYNSNPAYHTKGFQFYLNPDTGQQNINCDPAKSDFNTLTIRSTAGGNKQYRTVEFIDQHFIHVAASRPADDLTVGQLRKPVEEALTQILSEMDQKDPNKKPEATQ